MVRASERDSKWSMVVDIDRCSGCQACVIACHAENNIKLPDEEMYETGRTQNWIRIDRYWEGEFPDVKARFLPVFCQHCGNAPCEPVCPVYATYHSLDGLNIQVYNRCVGTRFCANNDPYNVRFFNWWEPIWPDIMRNYLNPDVTVRSKGIMEKCTMCVHRIRRAERTADRDGREINDGELMPACAQACPTGSLVFGDLNDDNSKVSHMVEDERAYRLLESLGTGPNVVYLKKVDPEYKGEAVKHHG
ncbi:MAG: 4Fe-4S dicluster domain-containing protein [SAR202 cluster bacterium]|nr:4Fe-4S dicluster domain-containing protein [SAR202 cluster bacterium]|tara:strand:+ start:327 stop:1067 length:741 start_codon:yes stop_codon:yes gene_type:complete